MHPPPASPPSKAPHTIKPPEQGPIHQPCPPTPVGPHRESQSAAVGLSVAAGRAAAAAPPLAGWPAQPPPCHGRRQSEGECWRGSMGRFGLSWPPRCSALRERRVATSFMFPQGHARQYCTAHRAACRTAHSAACCSTGHPGPSYSAPKTRFRAQPCASRRSHQSGRLQSESGAARLQGVPGGPPGAAGRCRSWPANQCTCTHK